MQIATRRIRFRVLFGLLLPLAGVGMAQDGSAPAWGGERARLTLGLLQTWESKATRRMFALGPIDVAAGDRLPDAQLPEIAFALEREGDDCEGSMTFESAETLLETHALVWTASFEVLSASTDRIELRGRWRRLGKGARGRPEELAADPDARLNLREGDRVLLDFARSPDPRCARSFALELSAELAEDPALAREQVGFEMWLVHESPGAEKRSDYLRLTATQGQELAFQFPHVRVPASVGSHEVATELHIDVRGTVRGRIRPDGSIDLSLESERTLWYVAPDGAGEHVGDGGEKLLNVRPGEVLRVELPGPTRNTQRPERYARDLAGHSFSLILRARVVS
jgi:hypothetical protein